MRLEIQTRNNDIVTFLNALRNALDQLGSTYTFESARSGNGIPVYDHQGFEIGSMILRDDPSPENRVINANQLEWFVTDSVGYAVSAHQHPDAAEAFIKKIASRNDLEVRHRK
jgi:hypothetical protein